MSVAQFTIPGKPISKGRPKFARQGNFIRTYTPEKTVNYENLVKLAWMQSGCDKLDGDISAKITAYFSIPKSVSKKRRAYLIDTYYDKKPDADNIAKAILDALNGIAYEDDSQVVSLEVIKVYNQEDKCDVILEELESVDG